MTVKVISKKLPTRKVAYKIGDKTSATGSFIEKIIKDKSTNDAFKRLAKK